MDVNGILHVSARDVATGKSEKITVNNGNGGRLSAEEIERMIFEAEEFAEIDKQQKERVEGRNGLESFSYNLRNQVKSKEMEKVLDEDDREAVSYSRCGEDKAKCCADFWNGTDLRCGKGGYGLA